MYAGVFTPRQVSDVLPATGCGREIANQESVLKHTRPAAVSKGKKLAGVGVRM